VRERRGEPEGEVEGGGAFLIHCELFDKGHSHDLLLILWHWKDPHLSTEVRGRGVREGGREGGKEGGREMEKDCEKEKQKVFGEWKRRTRQRGTLKTFPATCSAMLT